MPSLEIDPEAGFRVDSFSGSDERARPECVVITLDRPERLNSQTPTTWEELIRVRRELPGTVRVVVLRGTGRAFSAGLDRSLLSGDGILALPRAHV